MLRRKTTQAPAAGPNDGGIDLLDRMGLAGAGRTGVDRRTFLRGSGLAIGGLAAIGATGGTVAQAQVAEYAVADGVQKIKSVCTHCSVGCTVIVEVANGVWFGQHSRPTTRPSTSARIAPRGPRSASMPMASGGSSIR